MCVGGSKDTLRRDDGSTFIPLSDEEQARRRPVRIPTPEQAQFVGADQGEERGRSSLRIRAGTVEAGPPNIRRRLF